MSKWTSPTNGWVGAEFKSENSKEANPCIFQIARRTSFVRLHNKNMTLCSRAKCEMCDNITTKVFSIEFSHKVRTTKWDFFFLIPRFYTVCRTWNHFASWEEHKAERTWHALCRSVACASPTRIRGNIDITREHPRGVVRRELISSCTCHGTFLALASIGAIDVHVSRWIFGTDKRVERHTLF